MRYTLGRFTNKNYDTVFGLGIDFHKSFKEVGIMLGFWYLKINL